jgi:hypothetical protein
MNSTGTTSMNDYKYVQIDVVYLKGIWDTEVRKPLNVSFKGKPYSSNGNGFYI